MSATPELGHVRYLLAKYELRAFRGDDSEDTKAMLQRLRGRLAELEAATRTTWLTVGSLFAGIGGMDLGLERAGMRIRWQVEVDDYATRVLAKHWPDVARFRDVRDVGRRNLEHVDVVCGGFPCQDVSSAGRRSGIDGERSGLWREFARIVGELRPRYVLVENVADLLVRGMGRVLGDLAALGYDAEWAMLPAATFGAPHLRERVWIVAYPDGTGQVGPGLSEGREEEAADSGWSGPRVFGPGLRPSGEWLPEPGVGRVASRTAARVDRLRCLGALAVPQVVEWIGRRILEAERRSLLTLARESYPDVEWEVVDDRQSGHVCLQGTETRPSGKKVRVLYFADMAAPEVVVESARRCISRAKPLEMRA